MNYFYFFLIMYFSYNILITWFLYKIDEEKEKVKKKEFVKMILFAPFYMLAIGRYKH